jgi:hypothetical protein
MDELATQDELIGYKTGHTDDGDVLLGAMFEGREDPVVLMVLAPEDAVAMADELMHSADNAVHASRARRRG